MKKIKGSSLIEVMIGLAILVVVITVSAKVLVEVKKGFEVRYIEEEIARDIYCVAQELKYNYKIEEIIEKSEGNTINLKYTLGLSKYLLKSDLLDLEVGEGLNIKINNSDKENMEIFLSINYSGSNYKCLEERKFIKSRWMDE